MFTNFVSKFSPATARLRQLATQVSPQSSGRGGAGKGIIGLGIAGIAAAGLYTYSNAKPKQPPMDPNEFRPYKLKEIEPLNHNTSIFRFALEDPNQTLGMPTTSFVLTKVTPQGKDPVIRPYTPTNRDDAKGHFDLLVKRYGTGAMSSHIHSLKPGDTLEVKGPIVKYPLAANQHKKIAMIAGGTGITPMLQIINKLLNDATDKTELTLIFGNISENDILLKSELDRLVQKHGGRFKTHYVVDSSANPKAWTASGGLTGFINKDILSKHLPKPSEDNIKVFICGPPMMVKSISGSKAPDYSQGELDGILKDLGYKPDQVFKL